MTDQEQASQRQTRKAPSPPDQPADESSTSGGRRVMRWVVVVLAVFLFGLLMREVLYPFRGRPYMEISHGDHTHYVPKDRNETVPVSAFPTRRPGADERITPDGDIVSNR